MRFILNIKPSIYKGRTKADVISKSGLSRGSYTFTKNFSGYSSRYSTNDTYYYVINLIKKRKKSKELSKDKNGKTKSIIINNAEWTGYLYKIPAAALELLNLKIEQKSRNFVIIKNK